MDKQQLKLESNDRFFHRNITQDIIHMSKMQVLFPEADDKKAHQNSFNYMKLFFFLNSGQQSKLFCKSSTMRVWELHAVCILV